MCISFILHNEKGNHMKLFSILFLVLLLYFACNKYENKSHYDLTIGDEVQLYFTTNSCCDYCLSNELSLKHMQLIEKRIMNRADNCIGCEYNVFFIFKAESRGVDTIKLKRIKNPKNCKGDALATETYSIKIE